MPSSIASYMPDDAAEQKCPQPPGHHRECPAASRELEREVAELSPRLQARGRALERKRHKTTSASTQEGAPGNSSPTQPFFFDVTCGTVPLSHYAELTQIEVGIGTLGSQQFPMRALLDNVATVHDHEVGINDRRQTVRELKLVRPRA